jgi:cytochrome c biogenesis protein CcdA
MDIGRLGLAFTAGIFAFLSPCALPLLPSYIVTNFFNRIPLFNLKPLKSSSPFSYLVYGVGYAFASMSCSLPIFMLLIGQSITMKLFENITLYFFYGLGVSSILFPLTIMLYFSQDHLFSKIIESLPHIRKISSFILIISGLFMLYLSFSIYFY